ncbi:MAG: hypothetical protein ISS02_02570, partial [Candidatus Portnoybacteria bacterium]|nr:hypothetical protein [Candidatus Portnoybacteria bacterium]
YLEEQDYDDILEEIEGINVATYKWKDDTETTDKMLGIIAEEAPEQVLSNDNKSVSLYDYASFALAGVKAVKSEVDKLKIRIDEIGQIIDSSAESQNETNISLSGLVLDSDGYAVIDKLKVEELEIVKGGQLTLPQGANEIMGTGEVATSSDYTIIENNKIQDDSKVFISFTSNLYGASWWVCDKIENQSFKVCLDRTASTSLSFDYWIVQTKEDALTETVIEDNSASSADEPASSADEPASSADEPASSAGTWVELTPEETFMIELSPEEMSSPAPAPAPIVEPVVEEIPVEEELVEEPVAVITEEIPVEDLDTTTEEIIE